MLKNELLYMHLPIAGSRVTCAIEVIDERTAAVAFAFCSPRDQFCRRKGRKIAAQRLAGHYNIFFATLDPKFEGGPINEIKSQILAYLALPSPYVPTWVMEYKHECVLTPQSEIDRLRTAIQQALDYASHRWSEWGDRAVGVAEILEKALEESHGNP